LRVLRGYMYMYCAIEQAENPFDIICTHLTADDSDLSKIGVATILRFIFDPDVAVNRV